MKKEPNFLLVCEECFESFPLSELFITKEDQIICRYCLDLTENYSPIDHDIFHVVIHKLP